ncbi:GPP34 family phosphoprotein [Streptomyces antimycoticus]
MVSRERKRRPGLFHPDSPLRREYPAQGRGPAGGARRMGGREDARTAVLIGLISASGGLPSLHRTIPRSGKVYERAKEVGKGAWGADAVNTAVMRTSMAITVGCTVAVTSAVDGGGIPARPARPAPERSEPGPRGRGRQRVRPRGLSGVTGKAGAGSGEPS